MKMTEVKKQSDFCKELMGRLDKDIKDAEIYYGRINGKHRMKNDILRLRRELLALEHMINDCNEY